MKININNLILWITILLTQFVFGQYPQVTIPGSEVRKITSKIVNGQEYDLEIVLPSGYANSNKKYAVVYLMDSQWDLPLISSIYGEQYFDGFIPEIIIVGITWGGTKPNADLLRARDYTPTNLGMGIQAGGADQFLDFIKTEVFPFMDANYKVDNSNRTLMGCSLGGLFTLYSLFTHPTMFNNYIAASPAIGWDNEIMYSYEKKYSENKNAPPAKLFMTIGDVERNVGNFEKLTSHMQNKKYGSLQFRSKILENTGHSGTKSETYARGLQYVFEKPDMKVAEDILKKYAGQYQSANGNIMELKTENYQLVLYKNQNNSYVLKASGNTTFYSKSEFLNIEFDTKNPNTFQLNGYGNSEVFTKK
ncbi:alpha/beta hydrolase-fold protein [Flavobacterium sp.]|uniref:alpha/beta hydrolase n=1 Tax=Flavobacterium sp. TaxID=239 RepID=UPI003263C7FB